MDSQPVKSSVCVSRKETGSSLTATEARGGDCAAGNSVLSGRISES